jgi:hypothetical protein
MLAMVPLSFRAGKKTLRLGAADLVGAGMTKV